ncbi:MAG: TIGR02253 family HAD-type hydrolase [Candidatus Aenigmarchaeota archaeon]|nr:TIGR02253 family HAD-type hydrolase [Candidatus Aenigmarchaeota archaeon]
MIRAVLFDLDNTLIDFMQMKRKSCEAAVEAMIASGLEMSKGKVLEILFELYDKYGIEYGMIFQELLKRLTGRVDYRMLAEGVVAYRKGQAACMRTYPNAKKTLVGLKAAGIKLAIVSDAPSVNGWIRLVELGLQDFFDVVVTLHDTGESKPSPLPFKKAVERLGVSPGECLFVGDWVEKDIKGARALGMKTAFARYGAVTKTGKAGRTRPYRPERSGADYDIDDISEILSLVRQRDLRS